ncbi:MAG: hypothetical protein LUO89_00935 [Methanothrix sp.]|nr:hypothetical protein [Methanothrix sp.]
MKVVRLFLAVLFCIIAVAVADDEFAHYLGENVTVNACNVTVYQGMMIENWPENIVIKELCNPELGNVTIKKSCIVSINEGFECLT